VFRLQIDPASGKVSGVTVVKSTGVDALDDSAVHALRMWRIKPGRWRELDIPITFGM
jgi:TonB family protein